MQGRGLLLRPSVSKTIPVVVIRLKNFSQASMVRRTNRVKHKTMHKSFKSWKQWGKSSNGLFILAKSSSGLFSWNSKLKRIILFLSQTTLKARPYPGSSGDHSFKGFKRCSSDLRKPPYYLAARDARFERNACSALVKGVRSSYESFSHFYESPIWERDCQDTLKDRLSYTTSTEMTIHRIAFYERS